MVGVDVAKCELVVWSGQGAFKVTNSETGIRRLLEGLASGCGIAMEATGPYHLALADAAFEAGHEVFVLNPKDVARYKASVAPRGKTDGLDAKTIARYAEREKDSLRRYRPLPAQLRHLRNLLLRRAKLVEAKVKVRQSLSSVPELGYDLDGILERLDATIARIDEWIQTCLEDNVHFARLQQIPGVGPVTAATLVAALERGEFPRADSFVSFLGLDPLPNDSGKRRGRRRLSKMGDASARKLAYTAAMSAARTAVWKPHYERFRVRLSTTESLVALSRKMVRTAWSLYKHQSNFDPLRI